MFSACMVQMLLAGPIRGKWVHAMSSGMAYSQGVTPTHLHYQPYMGSGLVY